MQDVNVKQKELNELYKNVLTLNNIKVLKDRDKLSAPLLIKAYDSYLNSDIKIMYIGKETNHWLTHESIEEDKRGLNGTINENGVDIDRLLERYNKRMTSKENWEKTAFFKQYKNIKDQLVDNEIGNASVVWNNLFKMAYDTGKGFSKNSHKHSKKLQEISKELFLTELEILNPDVLIFVTGPKYDKVIKDYLSEITDENVEIRKRLWKFKCGERLCYRTVHPHYMQIENKDDYIQKIIKHIERDFTK